MNTPNPHPEMGPDGPDDHAGPADVEGEFLLADYATATPDGKLTVVGTWSVTGPEPVPSALAANLRVPRALIGQPIRFRFELHDEDGRPALPGPIEGEARDLTLADGFPEGTALDLPIAIPMGPLPLQPGRRYEWRMWVNDRTRDHWRKGFYVRPAHLRRAS